MFKVRTLLSLANEAHVASCAAIVKPCQRGTCSQLCRKIFPPPDRWQHRCRAGTYRTAHTRCSSEIKGTVMREYVLVPAKRESITRYFTLVFLVILIYLEIFYIC